MWEAKSPSDPAPGLKYSSKEAAEAHANRMNILLETFEEDETWNKTYWKSKPQAWVVNKIEKK